ncbi:alpha/beta fold hydrolase [Telluribacter sp. SYSU D00476]|uniref:alpha/beta fold hydrolase n=1 Tax=Telluribacter sp. SYSU D00476 TaxID=2811430 RepID=UPI001FF1C437|nr:alpha/beta hydrolase [Telluribacter sp. SYSU D00476]
MKTVILLLLGISLTAGAQTNQNNKVPALGINLEGYSYPYPVHFHLLESQGQPLRMAYMHQKTSKARKGTVVLMHGKNFNGAYWGETMKYLLDSGYDVFVPDQIGFGKSTKPDHYHYTFQQLALNTKSIIDSLGIRKVVVLGHSMGGMLATRYALMFPEQVEKLILENPIGLEDWKLKVPYQPVESWYRSELKKTYEGLKKYMLTSYYDNKWRPEYDPWLNLSAAVLDSPDYPRYAWNAALTYDMIFTQPVRHEFRFLKVPTVLIIGQRDKTALGKDLVSEAVAKTMGNYATLDQEVAQEIPNSRLLELEGIGHLPHIENFPLFKEHLSKALEK